MMAPKYEDGTTPFVESFRAGRCGRRAGACGRLPVLSGAVGRVRRVGRRYSSVAGAGRVREDGHFVVRTTAALPAPPV